MCGLLNEHALRRGNPTDAGIELDRFPECTREGFEADLHDVVQILPLVEHDMQIRLRAARERLEEDLRQLDVPVSQLRFGQRHAPDEEGTTRKIDGSCDSRLVHWKGRRAVATNARSVAQRLEYRGTEHDADVLGGVVTVDFDIPGGLNREVDQAVPRNLLEHVRQERERRLDVGLTRTVEVQLHADRGLSGSAFDASTAIGHLNSSTFHAPCSRTSSTVPPAP